MLQTALNGMLTAAWILGTVYSTIPVFWLAIHPFAAQWRARRGKIYPLIGLIWLAEIFAVLAVTRAYRHEVFYSNPWTWLLWVVFSLAASVLYRRIGTDFGLRRFIGKSELRPKEEESRLITTGMHGKVRHPIYLAHLLTLTGLMLGSGLKVLFAEWLFAVVTGVFMVRMEEAELEDRFGEEYREYKRRVRV